MDVPTYKRCAARGPEAAPPELPAAAALYTGGGIPQLFRRLGTAEGADAWLYVPAGTLDSLVPTTPATEGQFASAEGLTVDDSGRFCPLVVGGAVRGFLSGMDRPDGAALKAAVLDWLRTREIATQATLLPAQAELAAALVACDLSPERLLRNALNLLVEQVPSGLAAVYGESEGVYGLRTAVGDIAMWDMLEGTLPHATVGRWMEGLAVGRHFLPAGFLPERPMLLDAAPDFLFVHEGLRCSRPRSFVIMPVPGDIAREAGERLLTIARFIAALDADGLSITEDLINVCGQFRFACDQGRPGRELLENLFEVLQRRMGLSRIVLAAADGGGAAAVGRPEMPPSVRAESSPGIAAAIQAAARGGRSFSPDVSALGLLDDDEAKRYYLDNVRSEYCVRPRDAGCGETLVAFGHPETGLRLRQFERLLDSTAMLLDLYYQLEGRLNASPGAADAQGKPERRWATASAMAEGHFHAMYDTLSGLLGKTEVAAAIGGAAAQTGHSPAGEALARVVRSLDHLRALVRDTASAADEPVAVERALAELPGMLEGKAHHLEDLRGLALTVAIGPPSGRSFSILRRDLYDHLYPALLAVMEAAVRSGEVRIRAATHRGADAVEVTCPAPLLGRRSIADVMQVWTGEAGEREGGGRTLFDAGRYVWVCDARGRDPQRAWLAIRHDINTLRPDRPVDRHDREVG